MKKLSVVGIIMTCIVVLISCSDSNRLETQEEKDRKIIKKHKIHKMIGETTSCDSNANVMASEIVTFDLEGFQTSTQVFYDRGEVPHRHKVYTYNTAGDLLESKDELTGSYILYKYDNQGRKSNSKTYLADGTLSGSASFDWSDTLLITTYYDVSGKELHKNEEVLNEHGHITHFSFFSIEYGYDYDGRITSQTKTDKRSGRSIRTENTYKNDLLVKRVVLENDDCKSVTVYSYENFIIN